MAKLSVDEFNQKWSEKLKDNEDLAIELMEDASDSFNRDMEEDINKLREEKDAEITRISEELADLKTRYKERFLTPASKELIEEIKEVEPVELQEEEVIDIKEI